MIIIFLMCLFLFVFVLLFCRSIFRSMFVFLSILVQLAGLIDGSESAML